MSPETSSYDEKPRGERWLDLLGYGHLKGRPTPYEIDGESVPVEQFDRFCAGEAGPVFVALENMDKNDPRYAQFLGAARAMFDQHFLVDEE